VFDFDLQMRFWRSVTDVMVHGAQAALAATTALQEQMLAPVAKPQPTPQSSPMLAMFDPAVWMWGGPGIASQGPFASVNPMSANPFLDASPWIEIFWRQSADMMPVVETAWGSFPQPNPAAMLAPFFGLAASPWAFMQTPLTAMIMQAGFPYDVASPSAKAGTAAMDAADAARQQMDHVMSAYRTDGGHAAAQFAAMPWSFAAAFMTFENQPLASAASNERPKIVSAGNVQPVIPKPTKAA
jgi:hypothetical protein